MSKAKNTVPFDEEETQTQEEPKKKADQTPDTPETEDSAKDQEDKQPVNENTKKRTPKGEKPKSRSNQDVGIEYKKMSERMKKALDAQPRVQFYVPLGLNEQVGAWESVQINGYRMVIKKGVMVNIPQQVAQILADHYQIQMEAGSDYLIDRDEDIRTALE